MSDYSFWERLLHRLAFSSQMMREISFDLERNAFGADETGNEARHVFVAGMARGGTTILLRALHASGEFASLTYADMPFVLAPNFGGRLFPQKGDAQEKERAHGDGIMVTTSSPEAFEEVFWQTFDGEEAKENFGGFIAQILKKYGEKRYLSKNNQNVRRLPLIAKLMPEAHILVPYRSPLHHAASLLSQHRKFSKRQREDAFTKSYMDWIGHSEFGLSYRPLVAKGLEYKDPDTLDHWLEQWLKTYEKLSAELPANGQLICYEKLCEDASYWQGIRRMVGIEGPSEFEFRSGNRPVEEPFDAELLTSCEALYAKLS